MKFKPILLVLFVLVLAGNAFTQEIISREDIRESEWRMKSEYYQLRGWDVESGLPREAGLNELGLDDIAADLKSRDLLR